HVQRVKTERTAKYLELVRGDVHARYTLSRLGGPLAELVEVSVFGPQTVLPTPSAAERAAWTAEKRQYVKDANGICARAFARLRKPKAFAGVLTKMSRSLAALTPPVGERGKAGTFLRPLHK